MYVLEFAIQEFQFWYPTEIPTEKRIKLFYEEEVEAKSTSVGSFNMYFNLSKTLTDDAKELLKLQTTDADHEFTTTDAIETIVSVFKPTSIKYTASIACTGFMLNTGAKVYQCDFFHPLIIHSNAR